MSPDKQGQTTSHHGNSVGGSNLSSTKENTAADSKCDKGTLGGKSQYSGNVLDLDQNVAQESYSNTTFDLTPKQSKEDNKSELKLETKQPSSF